MLTSDLTIVHLTDLHLRESSIGKGAARPGELASAIRSAAKSTKLIIAFTGDVAFSGVKSDYALASTFLLEVIDLLATDFDSIDLAAVPGNHDVDLGSSTLRQSSILGILQNPPPSSVQLKELSLGMREFFNFTRGTFLEWANPTADSGVFILNSQKIQITGVNTSMCSRMDEHPSTLFVSVPDLPKRRPDAILNIVLMHHPLHWLHESVRKLTADWISETAEIVLMGHEHETDQIEITRRNLPATHYIAGTPLYDPNAKFVGLQILNLDLTNRKVLIETIVASDSVFKKTESLTKSLSTSLERNKQLRPTPSYLASIDQLNIGLQHKTGKSVTHSSIFVYPSVRVSDGTKGNPTVGKDEQIDGASLADRILLHQEMLIVGEEYSGKTFLLRQLFKDFIKRGVYPLLISAKLVNSLGILKAIEVCISSTYEINSDYDYWSVPKHDRILLLEDIDALPDLHKDSESLFEHIRNRFGSYACSCKELMLLRDPLTGDPKEDLWRLTSATIAPFAHTKTAELVARWVGHDNSMSTTDAHNLSVSLEKRVQEILNQKAVPSVPMILTLLLESMDSREGVDESTGAFGYHYQRLILRDLLNEQVRRNAARQKTVTDDIALELLGRLAFRAYDSGRDIDVTTARLAAVEMRNELLIEFSVDAAIETLVSSGLMILENSDTLRFHYKYVYQYSVAKLLALWLNNDLYTARVRSEVAKLTLEMHRQECASILIFFTFLTRDSQTIQGLIDQARSTFADCAVCDFDPSVDRLLKEPDRPRFSPSPDVIANRRALNERRDIEAQRSQEELARFEVVREEARESLKEIERAFQCMQVLGQILRAYPTRLSGEEKKRVGSECYKLGLRTLTKFIELLESSQVTVKDYFRKITAGHVDSHDLAQMEEEVVRQVSHYVQFGSLGIVKRVARAVGSVHL